MLKKVELSKEQHIFLMEHCRSAGIKFISTPYDQDSARLLCDLGVDVIKVASTDTTNIPFLRFLRSLGKPLILSTGVTALEELDVVMKVFENDPLLVILMHCVSYYPAPIEQLNLKAINTLGHRFKRPVGFSDHSASLSSGAWAVAAGAIMLEKHFTFDKTAWGPDHAASLDPQELRTYIANARQTHQAMGDGIKRVMPCEAPVKSHMQKGIVAGQDLPAGHKLQPQDLWTMRPVAGFSALDFDKLVGRTLKTAKRKFEPIYDKDI
jgi:sialic acid synthase SpsE